MSLTVAEKTHWKGRIEELVERKITSILTENPGFMDRFEEQAMAAAQKTLGIVELNKKIKKLEEELSAVSDKLYSAKDEMYDKVVGSNPAAAEGESLPYWQRPHAKTDKAARVLREQKEAELNKLLASDPVGREITALKASKEDAMDAVWLATSDKQIGALWQQVEQMLGLSSSKLLDTARDLIKTKKTAEDK